MDPSKWFLFPFKDRFSASSLERCLKNCLCLNNWAASWQNQQNGMCTQSDLLCALWVAKDHTVLHANSKDWSDWADAQVDLSLRWRTYHYVCFISMWLSYYNHMYVLSVNVLGLSDISGSKCMLRLKLWWFNMPAVLCPWARHFTPRKYWLLPRKRWLRPDMTEKLLTGTLSLNTNKQMV